MVKSEIDKYRGIGGVRIEEVTIISPIVHCSIVFLTQKSIAIFIPLFQYQDSRDEIVYSILKQLCQFSVFTRSKKFYVIDTTFCLDNDTKCFTLHNHRCL